MVGRAARGARREYGAGTTPIDVKPIRASRRGGRARRPDGATSRERRRFRRMRTPVSLLSLAAAAALAAAAPATAAPWSAPVTISAPHTFVASLDATATTTSTAAWWTWQDGVAIDPPRGAAFAVRPAGGVFAAERPVSTFGEGLLDVQGHGDGRLVALSQDFVSGPRRDGTTLFDVRVADGDASGFRAPVRLARAGVVGRAQLSVAPNGRGAVAYMTFEPKTHRRVVRVALRSTSGRFARPEVISGRGQAEMVAVAAGRRGDVVVAYVRNKRVYARVRRPGHGWGRAQTLAEPDGPTQWQLRAAVTDGGSVEVLWRKRRLRREGRVGLRALQASRMAATGSRFASARTIEADGASPPSELVAIPGGFAVGYTVPEPAPGTHTIPRVALLTPGAGAPLDVAAASGGVRDVRLAWS
ncbi:MAG: hypothetical protein QOI73_585, partial [Solirubrobacteraceae bacterium]|nr:hypothetical protein [Solirubrobacteraceae bacterium]